MRRILFLTASLGACGPKSKSGQSELDAIIDQNTMSAIDARSPIDESIREKLGALGKMTGGCTAFHLGEGVVASAGHCLAPEQEEACHNLLIDWGVTADGSQGERSRCLKTLDRRLDDGGDYALLLVDPVPSAALKTQHKLDQEKTSHEALVIGYPKDQALSWSGLCETSSQDEVAESLFYHRCDTLPGNSGSPVISAETREVIGVHNGEVNAYENYGSILPSSEQISEKQIKAEAAEKIEDAGAQHDGVLRFGPFSDKLNRNLVNFKRKQGSLVSFDLSYDIEDGYDKLIIVDGSGHLHELSGKRRQSYRQLPTPVSLAIVTDYSGPSHSVVLSSLSFE